MIRINTGVDHGNGRAVSCHSIAGLCCAGPNQQGYRLDDIPVPDCVSEIVSRSLVRQVVRCSAGSRVARNDRLIDLDADDPQLQAKVENAGDRGQQLGKNDQEQLSLRITQSANHVAGEQRAAQVEAGKAQTESSTSIKTITTL